MEAIDRAEKAIRTAFQKGNAEDRTFREKVYRSTFAALERALQANQQITVENAIKLRKALQAKIAEIESEFVPGARVTPAADAAPWVEPEKPAPVAADTPSPQVSVEPEAERKDVPAAPYVSIQPEGSSETSKAPAVEAIAPALDRRAEPVPSIPSPAVAERRKEPSFEGPSAIPSEPAGRAEPRLEPDTRPSPDDAPLPTLAGEREQRPESSRGRSRADPDAAVERERRRPFAAMFFIVTLLVLAAIGAWWAMQTGLFLSDAERDSSVPNPSIIESEDFDPATDGSVPPVRSAQQDALQDWISIFSPADASTVNAPNGATAEVVQEEEGPVLRISAGTSREPVRFDVGQGILEQIAGRRAVFDIVARSQEGQQTQISVECNLAGLGDCGRKRYEVSHEQGEFLFEVELPDRKPEGGGTISINPDVTGSGKSVDIVEIRVSVSP